MSVKIKINWDNENIVSESVRIYRADSTFTKDTLPPVLAEIFGDVYGYEDTTAMENETYFYMLSSKLDNQEAFTECFEVKAEVAPVDIFFDKVALLMQFDSPNPLVDQKTSIEWQLFGDASIETITSKNGALRVSDAVTSYMQSPTLKNIYSPNIAGKELTIEFYFKKTSDIGNAGAVCFQNAASLSERCALFMRSGSSNFNCAAYTPQGGAFTFIDVASGVNLNEWAHFAYVEYASVTKLYINGKQKASYGATPFVFWENTIVTVGQNGIGGEPFGGYIDGLRISKTARYKSNFIPPDLPLPSR